MTQRNSYSYLRRQYKQQIKTGNLYCVLSGLPILQKQDLSLEHYYPKVLDVDGNTYDVKNIFPAIKIINNIKSNKKPCEWENEKFDILYHAVYHYRLNDHDYNIVVAAINNIDNYRINPCLFCINNIKCKQK